MNTKEFVLYNADGDTTMFGYGSVSRGVCQGKQDSSVDGGRSECRERGANLPGCWRVLAQVAGSGRVNLRKCNAIDGWTLTYDLWVVNVVFQVAYFE